MKPWPAFSLSPSFPISSGPSRYFCFARTDQVLGALAQSVAVIILVHDIPLSRKISALSKAGWRRVESRCGGRCLFP